MTDDILVPQQWTTKLISASGALSQIAQKILDWLISLYAYGSSDPEEPEFKQGRLRLKYSDLEDKFNVSYYTIHRVLEVLEAEGFVVREIIPFAKGRNAIFISFTPEFLTHCNWDGASQD